MVRQRHGSRRRERRSPWGRPNDPKGIYPEVNRRWPVAYTPHIQGRKWGLDPSESIDFTQMQTLDGRKPLELTFLLTR